VIVITEDRADLTYNLQQYAEKVRDDMIRHGTDATKAAWKSIKVNGNDALRCILACTLKKIKVKYVVTIVQTGQSHLPPFAFI
jgi:hypothetical protein